MNFFDKTLNKKPATIGTPSLAMLLSSIAFSCTLSTTAQAEVAGNVSLTTDYVWRGISQNAEDPAIQGGFDWEHDTGWYAGAWGSSVDFNGPESTEIDLYAGWTHSLDNGIGLQIGYIEYTYHGQDNADDSNFTEYLLGVSYGDFDVSYYIGDEFNDNIEVSYGHEFSNKISVNATYGDYDTYNYYTLGVARDFAGITANLSYFNTDIKGLSEAQDRVVLSVSKSF